MSRTAFSLSLSLLIHVSLFAFLLPSLSFEPTSKETLQVHMKLSDVSLVSEPLSAPNQPEVAQEKALQTPMPKVLPNPTVSKPKKIAPSPITNKEPLPHEEQRASNTPMVQAQASQSIDTNTSETAAKPSDEQYQALVAKALHDSKSYPELARKRLIEGSVELIFTITPEGQLRDIQSRSHSAILEQAALQSLHQAQPFFPKPHTNVTLKVPMVYRLR